MCSAVQIMHCEEKMKHQSENVKTKSKLTHTHKKNNKPQNHEIPTLMNMYIG